MGYLTEKYTNEELNKISIPGRVVPSLFWLIPIGKWDNGDLDRLWRHFTEDQSICNKIGLMIVKRGHRNNEFHDRQKIDL